MLGQKRIVIMYYGIALEKGGQSWDHLSFNPQKAVLKLEIPHTQFYCSLIQRVSYMLMIQFWVKLCCKIIVEYSSWNKSRVRVWLSTHNVIGQRRESHSVGSMQCQCQMLPTWQQRFNFTHCRILKTSLVGSWIKKTITKYLCIILSTCRLEISSLDIFLWETMSCPFWKWFNIRRMGDKISCNNFYSKWYLYLVFGKRRISVGCSLISYHITKAEKIILQTIWQTKSLTVKVLTS